MILIRSLVLLTSLLFLVASASAQNSDVHTQIGLLRADWTTNLRQKRLEPFVMMYAPDATFIGGGKRFTGRSAIRELTKTMMEAFTSDVELRSIKIEFSGELAYDSGDYRETLTTLSDGSKKSFQGDYLTIYRRSGGRKWIIIQQVWIEASTPSHAVENADVLKEISNYYADMICQGDHFIPQFTDHFWSRATITTVWPPPQTNKAQVTVIPITEFLSRAKEGACSRTIFEEKIDGAEVKMEGGLAQVWARYKAKFGIADSVNEWTGVDAFTLLRHDGRWKIASLVFRPDSGRPTCAPK